MDDPESFFDFINFKRKRSREAWRELNAGLSGSLSFRALGTLAAAAAHRGKERAGVEGDSRHTPRVLRTAVAREV